ncbi:MAG: hypothetical protein K2G93_08180 [Rikenella sp.]|nr:hypothetical protein [Rikenella sp.]
MYNVGYSGYSWSSSVMSINAHFLNFNSGAVIPNSNVLRANGLQTRCLQE